MEGRGKIGGIGSFRISLEGRTNGLVRWLKRYEGAYRQR